MVRRLISDGVIGRIVAVSVWMNHRQFIDREAPLHWREDVERSGNNIMELGIVYESLMRWIGVATHVLARGTVNVPARFDPEHQQEVEVRIPDHLDVVADFPEGGQGHLQFSAVTGLAPPPSIWLFGEEGTLRYDIGTDSLALGGRNDRDLNTIDIPTSKEGRWKVEEEFVTAIRGNGEIEIERTSFEVGVLYMEFVDAVGRSLRSGCQERVQALDVDDR